MLWWWFLDMGNTSDQEYRRYQANTLLKQYITTNFDTNKVIVIGDLNDIIMSQVQTTFLKCLSTILALTILPIPT